jgi:putative transposase
VLDGCIQLPCIGVVRLKEHDCLPTDKRITQATIRERAGRWFVSVLVEEEAPTGDIPEVATEDMTEGMTGELIEVATETVSNKATSNVLGGDVGIKTLATCSDGTCCANPKALAAKIKFTERRSLRHAARSKRTVTPLRIKHCTLMLHAFFCVVASRR